MLEFGALSFSMRESSPPLRFGRYEVLFRIAAGGMAEVYAARMLGEGGFEKSVALKRMLPTLAEDERFVQMFLDEGRLAAHISSPHVVQTLDLGRAEDDSLYLVMELVVGVSLSALIRAVLKTRTPFPVTLASELLAQAASGLHDAHEARTMYGQPLQIVHRDVSPQNILVDVTGRVRITDFGVARALERATHTQSGEVKGKIGYFAPEQVRGGAIDRRTDVFALGIVAWETFAGRRLFAGDNPAQTLDQVMSMPIPRLDALRSDVPAALADVVAHALERDLSARTASAGDFAEELRYALRPAGGAALGALVRAHGGESLMKLEEGLRAQSPSSLSRVRRAEVSASGRSVSGMRAPVDSLPAPVPHVVDEGAVTRVAAEVSHSSAGQLTAVPVSLAPPAPAREPASLPRSWLLGAAAGVGVLAVVGLGAGYYVATRPVPEPTTMALPPLATPVSPVSATPAASPGLVDPSGQLVDPSGQPGALTPTPTDPATAAGGAQDTPEPVVAPHAVPRTGPGTTRGRDTPGVRAGGSAGTVTPSAGTTTTPSTSTTPGASGTPRVEPTPRQTGMRTGLVGVSDFERELGIE